MDVKPGEVVALSGPSGCGKSSLLRLVAGLLVPTRGTIALNGRVVSAPGILVPPGRRGLGLVFQDGALFPHLTAEENIRFGCEASPGAVHRVDDLIQMLGLAELRKRYPHQLSGGQQQRVALARACAPDPCLLLLDEAFAGLDRFRKKDILPLLSAMLHERGITSLLVTHDPEEADFLADRFVMMEDGGILQAGTKAELVSAPRSASVASYFEPMRPLASSAMPR